MRRIAPDEFDDATDDAPSLQMMEAHSNQPIWLRLSKTNGSLAPLVARFKPRGGMVSDVDEADTIVDICVRHRAFWRAMSDHQTAMSTDQEPTISGDHVDHQAAGLSIAEAARRLGVSENAIRQRIKRETVTATKVDGVWQVFVADHEADHQSDFQPTSRPTPTSTTSDDEADYQADQEPIEAQYRVTPAEIEQAIERTGDKYVVDMRAMLERVDELYRDRLADKDRIIVELEQQRDDERRRREAAESRMSALETAHTESLITTPETPETVTDAPWWQFWKR